MDINLNKIMKKFTSLIVVFILFVLVSCDQKNKTLKLIKVTEYNSIKISDSALIKVLKTKFDLDVEIHYTLSEDHALRDLEDKKVDLVIIPNNATSSNMTIKAIIPLLPRVLTIVTNKDVRDKNLKDILESGIVYFEERSRLDSLFFSKLFLTFNVDKNKIDERQSTRQGTIYDDSDSLKVYIGLTHMNNIIIQNLVQKDWVFYSLDDVDEYGKGSKVEGFTMMNMSVKPFIIPKSIFKGRPHQSVLTVSIYDILITRKDLSNELIYGITRTLYENRSRLIQMNPVYNLLNFNYDNHDLSFPLHKGTIEFIDRDQPPPWSKYVKMIWPLISISVVLFGILASLRTRFKRRKKQNIEMYYNSLLDIRSKSETATDAGNLIEILKELKVLRSQAMKSLADKKLDPGESFNIFLALYNDTKNELVDDLREIRLKDQENKA